MPTSAGRERGGVVDAVPDHGHLAFPRLQLFDLARPCPAGSTSAMHEAIPAGCAMARRSCAVVAGQHDRPHAPSCCRRVTASLEVVLEGLRDGAQQARDRPFQGHNIRPSCPARPTGSADSRDPLRGSPGDFPGSGADCRANSVSPAMRSPYALTRDGLKALHVLEVGALFPSLAIIASAKDVPTTLSTPGQDRSSSRRPASSTRARR